MLVTNYPTIDKRLMTPSAGGFKGYLYDYAFNLATTAISNAISKKIENSSRTNKNTSKTLYNSSNKYRKRKNSNRVSGLGYRRRRTFYNWRRKKYSRYGWYR